jgi:hypothetical protein
MSHESLFKQPRTFKLTSAEGSNFSKASNNAFAEGAGLKEAFKGAAILAAVEGGLSLIGGGISDIAGAGDKKTQAKNIEFSAKQEEIKGIQVAANFLEELNNIQASNTVIAFAQGRQLTGSAVSIRQELGLKAARSVRIVKLDQKLKTLALQRQSRYLKSVAKWQKTVGPIKIVAGVALTWAAFSALGDDT